MSKKNASLNQNGTECWVSALERLFISEYLISKGYQMYEITKLPKQKVKTLMKEACRYAALKLAEIEAKSKFRRNIKAP
jgi:hypothetical protein